MRHTSRHPRNSQAERRAARRAIVRRSEPSADNMFVGALLASLGTIIFAVAVYCIPDVPTHADPAGLAVCIFIVASIGAVGMCMGGALAFVGIFGARR